MTAKEGRVWAVQIDTRKISQQHCPIKKYKNQKTQKKSGEKGEREGMNCHL